MEDIERIQTLTKEPDSYVVGVEDEPKSNRRRREPQRPEVTFDGEEGLVRTFILVGEASSSGLTLMFYF